jgi:hypothetical protein
MSWPDPGVYPNISPEDYFGLSEIDGVRVRSNSMLHAFDRDPAEFFAGWSKKPTAAMRRGSIFDCLITQQHRFADQFIMSPFSEFKTNESKAWRDEQTRTVVKESEFHAAEAAVHAVHADDRWKAITEGNCQYQVGLRADIFGVPFKGLVDVLPDTDGPFGDAIVDVKRLSRMETLDDVLKTCRQFRYNDQMAVYRGLCKVNKLDRKRCILFVVSQNDPVTICVLELSPSMIDTGGHRIMRINERLVECEETGIWPSRFDGIKKIEQPDESWAWREEEDELETTDQPA